MLILDRMLSVRAFTERAPSASTSVQMGELMKCLKIMREKKRSLMKLHSLADNHGSPLLASTILMVSPKQLM